MKPKTIIIEILIVAAIFVITWLLFTHYVSNTTLDIDMKDTYFVIQPAPIILTAGLLIITLVYLIKEGFKRYKRRFQNIILLVANFLVLVKLYPYTVFASTLSSPGWTIYPPLSALGKNIPPISEKLYHHLFVLMLIKQILPFIVVLFMLILVITAVITGKNWHTQPHEQTTS
ncbi:hypothetical protein SAMN05216464_104158 [Mucilaginibacter pineti]|uniref:Uncharacterized protein n=1 Tax=Mucilaginibacter pineti TaxID=1391627 RepID=A0A1G7ALF7_9SPHI|nr:hypothetical protein [Mucilaginibacter pineti]SDE15550.1 hypothetical protein SAMN05216464_104158 [Mucilaginibacter pineti]